MTRRRGWPLTWRGVTAAVILAVFVFGAVRLAIALTPAWP